MYRLLLIFMLALPLFAQAEQDIMYRSSVAALASGVTLDIASSWTSPGVESNPIYGRGQYGMRQTMMSVGIHAGILAIQHVLIHRFPRLRRFFAPMNFGMATMYTVQAGRNWSLPAGSP